MVLQIDPSAIFKSNGAVLDPNDPDTRSEGAGQELKGKAEQVKGAAKEKIGRAIDDPDLEAEGTIDRAPVRRVIWRIQMQRRPAPGC